MRQSSYQSTVLPCHGTDLVSGIFKCHNCHQLWKMWEFWWRLIFKQKYFVLFHVCKCMTESLGVYVCVWVCEKWRVSIHSPEVYVLQFPNCCIFYCEMFVPGMFCFVLFFSYIVYCQLAIVECILVYTEHANFESITSIWSIERSGNK